MWYTRLLALWAVWTIAIQQTRSVEIISSYITEEILGNGMPVARNTITLSISQADVNISTCYDIINNLGAREHQVCVKPRGLRHVYSRTAIYRIPVWTQNRQGGTKISSSIANTTGDAYSSDFISPFGRVLLKQKKEGFKSVSRVATYGVGGVPGVVLISLATSIIGSKLLGAFGMGGGGGCDYCAAAFQAVNQQINVLQKEVDAIATVQQTATVAISQLAAANVQQAEVNSFTLQQFGRLGEQVTSIQNTVLMGFSINADINANQTRQINTLTTALSGVTEWTAGTLNVDLSIINQTNSRLDKVTQAAYQNTQGMAAINMNMYHVYRGAQVRRELIYSVNRSLEHPNAVTARPFVTDVGFGPLTGAAREAQSTIQKAQSVAEVHLFYTDRPASSNIATDLKWSFICDPYFLVDRMVTGMSLQTLLGFLGPQNSTTPCYSINGGLTGRWRCNCIMTVTKSTCTLNAGAQHLFPWTWPESTTLAGADAGQIALHCSNSITTSTLDPTQTTDTLRSIFSSFDQWVNYYSNWCSSSNWQASPLGHRIRVYSPNQVQNWNLTADITAVDSAGVSICDGSLAAISSANNNGIRIPYFIYLMAQMSYGTGIVTSFPAREQQLYGRMMSGIKTFSQFYNDDPAFVDSFQYHTAMYTMISDESVVVYRHQRVSTEAIVDIYVDGGTPDTLNSTGYLRTFNTSNGTVPQTFAVSAQLSQDPFQDNIPAVYFTAEGLGLGARPARIYDVPFNMLTDDIECRSQCRKMSYIRVPLEITGPINRTAWSESCGGIEYDPECTVSHPMLYQRATQVLADGSTVCDGFVLAGEDENDMIESSYLGAICSMHNTHRITYPTNYTWHDAKTFSIQATVTAPKGLYRRQIYSSCPTNYTVSTGPGTAVFVAFTTSNVTQTVDMILTQGGIACATPGVQRMQYSSSNPLTATISACGLQYVNFLTLYDDRPCFPAPGMSLTVSQQGFVGVSLTTDVINYITLRQDETQLLILQLQGGFLDLQSRILAIANDPRISIEDMAITINSFAAAFISTIQSIVTNGQAAEYSNNLLRNLTTQFAIQSIDNANRSRNGLDNLNASNIIYQTLVTQTTLTVYNLTLQQNLTDFILAAARIEIRSLQDYVNRLIADSNDGESCFADNIPLLGPIVCKIGNFFGNIFSFIGKLLTDLFMPALIVIGVVLLFCCVLPCCGPIAKSMCCNCFSKLVEKNHQRIAANKVKKAKEEKEQRKLAKAAQAEEAEEDPEGDEPDLEANTPLVKPQKEVRPKKPIRPKKSTAPPRPQPATTTDTATSIAFDDSPDFM